MGDNVKPVTSSSCEIHCSQCGACCVAPDISSLGKAAGVPCPHLMANNRCGVYDNRPIVCRQYRADEICLEIDAPTLEERVSRFQVLFGLPTEVKL
jgi:hypothetical protein